MRNRGSRDYEVVIREGATRAIGAPRTLARRQNRRRGKRVLELEKGSRSDTNLTINEEQELSWVTCLTLPPVRSLKVSLY